MTVLYIKLQKEKELYQQLDTQQISFYQLLYQPKNQAITG